MDLPRDYNASRNEPEDVHGFVPRLQYLSPYNPAPAQLLFHIPDPAKLPPPPTQDRESGPNGQVLRRFPALATRLTDKIQGFELDWLFTAYPNLTWNDFRFRFHYLMTDAQWNTLRNRLVKRLFDYRQNITGGLSLDNNWQSVSNRDLSQLRHLQADQREELLDRNSSVPVSREQDTLREFVTQPRPGHHRIPGWKLYEAHTFDAPAHQKRSSRVNDVAAKDIALGGFRWIEGYNNGSSKRKREFNIEQGPPKIRDDRGRLVNALTKSKRRRLLEDDEEGPVQAPKRPRGTRSAPWTQDRTAGVSQARLPSHQERDQPSTLLDDVVQAPQQSAFLNPLSAPSSGLDPNAVFQQFDALYQLAAESNFLAPSAYAHQHGPHIVHRGHHAGTPPPVMLLPAQYTPHLPSDTSFSATVQGTFGWPTYGNPYEPTTHGQPFATPNHAVSSSSLATPPSGFSPLFTPPPEFQQWHEFDSSEKVNQINSNQLPQPSASHQDEGGYHENDTAELQPPISTTGNFEDQTLFDASAIQVAESPFEFDDDFGPLGDDFFSFDE